MADPAKQHAAWVVVTGLDGAGKTTLVGRLAEQRGGFRFRLPYHDVGISTLLIDTSQRTTESVWEEATGWLNERLGREE